MSSINIHRLVARLHVPQVALRCTKEELLISLGSVSTLFDDRKNATAAVGDAVKATFPPPGVLGQRAARLAWQSQQLKELRILLNAASSMSWSGAMLPNLYDGICSSLLSAAASAAAQRSSTKDSTTMPNSSITHQMLAGCIVHVASLAVGRTQLPVAVEEKNSSASPVASEASVAHCQSAVAIPWPSLTLQKLVFAHLPHLDPEGLFTAAQAEGFEVVVRAAHSLSLVGPPPAEFAAWIVRVVGTYYDKQPAKTPTSTLIEELRSFHAFLPQGHTEKAHLSALCEKYIASSPSALSTEQSVLPVKAASSNDSSSDDRTRLLTNILRKSRAGSSDTVDHLTLSSFLKCWCSLDLRDEVAAVELNSLVGQWVADVRQVLAVGSNSSSGSDADGHTCKGQQERAQVHELLFYARRSASLRATCNALEDALGCPEFLASDPAHQSTALTTLASPDAALLGWEEEAQAPQGSMLFTMLNEASTYTLDQLATVVFLFPHRTSELQEICGRIRAKLRDSSTRTSSAPVGSGTRPDDANDTSAFVSAKGLGLLGIGLAKCNWNVEPTVEEIFVEVLHAAVHLIRPQDDREQRGVDVGDIARVACDFLLTTAPLVGHWYAHNDATAKRLVTALDAIACAVIDATHAHIVLGRGILEDVRLQDIAQSLGAYTQLARRRRGAKDEGERAMVARSIQWFDEGCAHMARELKNQPPNTVTESLQSVVVVLRMSSEWDRGHERLLDICKEITDKAWFDDVGMGSAVPLTVPIQNISASIVTLQSHFMAPELETSVEKLLRYYHHLSAIPDASAGPAPLSSTFTAALVLASVKTGHATRASLLVDRLVGSSPSTPAGNVDDLEMLLEEAEAVAETLKLMRNVAYVPAAAFEAEREAIVGHALEVAERLYRMTTTSSKRLLPFNRRSQRYRVEQFVEVRARLLCAARSFCNQPVNPENDSVLTSLADQVPFLSPPLVAELLCTPACSTSALVTAVCERMGSLGWTWAPQTLARALFGIGETQHSGTALVHQLALSSVAEHAVDHVNLFFQGSGIARMLLGFAKCHIVSRSLFNVFAKRLKKRPLHASMRLSDLSCALQAFGLAKYVDKDLFDAFGKRILAYGDRLGPADVTLTACAFSRAMLLHRQLYRGLGDRGAEIMAELPGCAASALIAAFGNVGERHQLLGEAAVTKQKLNELTAPEAANMLVGLWQMNFDDAGDHYDVLANRIVALTGEGLTQKEIVGICSVMHDTKWRHPSLLLTVAHRSAALMSAQAGEGDANRLSGDAARVVLDTLGSFGVHHAEARTALTSAAREVSREAVTLPDEERQLLLGGGL